ncbi:Peroxisomal nicotinamide adenine dinucleotide carrier [Dichanthelium oligosanthes]|uniref:Peroxisomal nicotinamide adenine dinucleotide carrier n=1 Tax=Dichanthelium oligosanthes TaxID=888268 RepID=A0A1E5VF17_9POAL|nr:Peroxisomal nicotinamide adenine dinucleotide carrier [Dichanthelium oligosanthes]
MSSAVVNGLAGAGGGIIAQIITYPLQTVNTRQQTERSAKKKKKAGSGATDTSTLFQMLQLIQTEGWGGLYSGLKPSLIGTAASQGIYYYFYQILKNKVEDVAVARGKKGLGDGTVGMLSWLGIAAVAGSINVLLTNPIWVLVTRMQVCNPSIQFMIYETLAKRLQSKRSGKQLPKRNLTAMEVQNFRFRSCPCLYEMIQVPAL